MMNCNPELTSLPDGYEFAVAILEGKPVFPGDIICHKVGCIPYKVCFGDKDLSNGDWTWNSPKKTFMLNGEELPCPVKPGEFVLRIQGFEDTICYFNNQGDIKKVENAIIKLLKESAGNGE